MDRVFCLVRQMIKYKIDSIKKKKNRLQNNLNF